MNRAKKLFMLCFKPFGWLFFDILLLCWLVLLGDDF